MFALLNLKNLAGLVPEIFQISGENLVIGVLKGEVTLL